MADAGEAELIVKEAEEEEATAQVDEYDVPLKDSSDEDVSSSDSSDDDVTGGCFALAYCLPLCCSRRRAVCWERGVNMTWGVLVLARLSCVCVAAADAEQTILERLEELHKQLASVRDERSGAPPGDDGGEESFQSSAAHLNKNKLIVCSVRRPVKMVKDVHSGALGYKPSTSPFTQAIHTLRDRQPVHWVAWPGISIAAADRTGISIAAADRTGVQRRLQVGGAHGCQCSCKCQLHAPSFPHSRHVRACSQSLAPPQCFCRRLSRTISSTRCVVITRV